MDLLDRYLAAVRKYLPWQRQDDIIAELRANLESQLEDKESELGRPLSKAEVGEWLKQFGPPIHVAARYQPQRYLIGPMVFPFYWFVMRMALTWSFIVYSIVMAIQTFVTQEPSSTALLEAVLRVPFVLFTTATWVTIVFAAIEYGAGRYPQVFKDTPLVGCAWSPETLPAVEPTAPGGRKRPSYVNAVAEVIFGFIFLVWLLLFPRYPFLLLGPGVAFLHSTPFEPAPVLFQFYWAVVALNILQLGWRGDSLWRGRWQRARPVQQIIIKAVGLIPILFLLSARDQAFALLKRPEVDGVHYGATLNSANHAIYVSVELVCAIILLQLLWEIGKTSLTAYRNRVAART